MSFHEIVTAAQMGGAVGVLVENGVDGFATARALGPAGLVSIGLGSADAAKLHSLATLASTLQKDPGLPEYLPQLAMRGLTSTAEVTACSDDELATIGMKAGHRVRLRQLLDTSSAIPLWAKTPAAALVKGRLEELRFWAGDGGECATLPAAVLLSKRARRAGARTVPVVASENTLERRPSTLPAQQHIPRYSIVADGAGGVGAVGGAVVDPADQQKLAAYKFAPRVSNAAVVGTPGANAPPTPSGDTDDFDVEFAPPPMMQDCEFYINEKIGQGSFGTVYKAGSSQGSQFAIKVISLLNDQAAAEAEKEFSLLEKLSHTNIVKVEKIYYNDNPDVPGEKAIHIVMELVSGGELDRVVNECGNSIESLKVYTYQILNGLSYLHKRKIVHSDIKPKNIMVEAPNTLKLTDFGLSKMVRREDEENGRRSGGTLMYQSPSMVVKGEATTQSDLWAFACTVLELGTGRRPWHEKGFRTDPQYVLHIGSLVGQEAHPSLERCHTELADFLKHAFAAEAKQYDCVEVFSHKFLSIDQPCLSVLAEQLRPQI